MFNDVSIVLKAQLVKILIALVLQSMIARFLTLDERGIYAICIAMSAILIVFTYFGNEFGIRYLLVTKQINATQATMYLTITILVSMLVALALVLLALNISFYTISGPTTLQITLAVIMAFSQLLTTQLNVVITISQKYVEASIFGILEEVLKIGSVFVFVLLKAPSVEMIMLAIIAANAISISIVIIHQQLYKFGRATFDIQHIVFFVKYGLNMFWMNLGNLSIAQLGTIVLAGVMTTAQIGLYHLAFGFVARIQVIPDAINRVLVPASVNSDNEMTRYKMMQVASTGFLAIAIFIVPVFFLFDRSIIILLFGREYAEAGTLGSILLSGFVFKMIGKPLEAYFSEVIGRPDITAKIQFFYVLAMLGFTYIGGVVSGPLGAAFGSALALIFGAVILFCSFSALTQRPVWSVISFRSLLAEWSKFKKINDGS